MLNTFRERHTKRILWGLVLTIVPAFVIWGGIASIQDRRKNLIGTINGTPVTLSEFRNYLAMARLYVIYSFPPDYQISPKELENLAFDLLLLNWQAKKESVTITDEKVAARISSDFFPQGSFDQTQYLQHLSRLSRRCNTLLTPRAFEEYVRTILTIDTLLATHSQAEVSDQEIRDAYLRDNRKAKIAYLRIPYDTFKVDMKASPQELEAFYQQNPNLFRREPKIKIRYILIPNDTNLTPHAESIRTSRSLSELAQKTGFEPKESGLIGVNDAIDGIGLAPSLSIAAFAAEKNTLSLPLETPQGFVVFEKIEEQAAATPAFQEILPEVESAYTLDNAKRDAQKYAQELLARMTQESEKNISKFADSTAEFKETGFFGVNDYIEGVGVDPAVSDIVFALQPGAVHPQVVNLPQGAYIIQLKEFLPFNEEEFEKQVAPYRERLQKEKEVAEKIEFLSQVRKNARLTVYVQE